MDEAESNDTKMMMDGNTETPDLRGLTRAPSTHCLVKPRELKNGMTE